MGEADIAAIACGVPAVRLDQDSAVAPIWRSVEFRRLWLGQSAGVLASAVFAALVPLYLAARLNADSTTVGLARAAAYLPILAFALPVGSLADRVDRRRLLVAAEVTRFGAVGGLALANVLGDMSAPLLICGALIAGCGTVASEVTMITFVADAIPHHALVSANSLLQGSESTGDLAGPALAGLAVSAFAGWGIATVASFFAVSAWTFSRLTIQPRENPAKATTGVRVRVGDGMRAVFRDPVLRGLSSYLAMSNLASEAAASASIVFLVRDLRLPAAIAGLVLSTFGVGLCIGAAASATLARRIGVGATLLAAALGDAVGIAIVGTTPGNGHSHIEWLITGMVVSGVAITTWNVQSISLRQATCPREIAGRVNAAFKLVGLGSAAGGALIGGGLAAGIGARPVLLCAAVVSAVAAAVFVGPLHRRAVVAADDGSAVSAVS